MRWGNSGTGDRNRRATLRSMRRATCACSQRYARPVEEHRKKRKSYNVEGHVHALTFSCYRRQPFFNGDWSQRLFLDCLGRARARHGFLVWAYVVMPEHVHLLIPPRGVHVDAILKAIKQPMSQRAVSFLKKADPEMLRLMISGMTRGHSPYSFWQGGGGFDQNLKSSEECWRMIDYIHMNPVRRGLVENPEDWPWSSCRFYRDLPPYEFEVDRCEERLD
jgi:putative transposase